MKEILLNSYWMAKESHMIVVVDKDFEHSKYVLLRTPINDCEHQISYDILKEKYINITQSDAVAVLSIQKNIIKNEKNLDKCRTSSFIDGWQTSKHAKKSRKWDYYAEEKRNLRNNYDDLIYRLMLQF